MTPWAELLLDPADAGEREVRARFHALSRTQHPDRDGAAGMPGPRWAAVCAAYQAVKTSALRAEWERRQRALAGRCAKCEGTGVSVQRTGKNRGVSVCTKCEGEGRHGNK